MRVLLAEDELVQRHIVCGMLERMGHEVVLAADGGEALAVLQQPDAPPIALLGWAMPALSGPEVVARVRAEGREPFPYTVLLGGTSETEGAGAGLAGGADDCLTRPPGADELRARLRAAVRILALEKELAAVRQELHAQSGRDPLTGLWNRLAIRELLEHELARSRRASVPLAVALVDIDDLASVNDAHGRPASDDVLREAARRLRSGVRGYDTAGRWGGNTFLLIVSTCALDVAARRADALRACIADTPMQTGAGDVSVTASVGLAVAIPVVGITGDTLVLAADAALARARERGRNRVECATAADLVTAARSSREPTTPPRVE